MKITSSGGGEELKKRKYTIPSVLSCLGSFSRNVLPLLTLASSLVVSNFFHTQPKTNLEKAGCLNKKSNSFLYKKSTRKLSWTRGFKEKKKGMMMVQNNFVGFQNNMCYK